MRNKPKLPKSTQLQAKTRIYRFTSNQSGQNDALAPRIAFLVLDLGRKWLKIHVLAHFIVLWHSSFRRSNFPFKQPQNNLKMRHVSLSCSDENRMRHSLWCPFGRKWKETLWNTFLCSFRVPFEWESSQFEWNTEKWVFLQTFQAKLLCYWFQLLFDVIFLTINLIIILLGVTINRDLFIYLFCVCNTIGK